MNYFLKHLHWDSIKFASRNLIDFFAVTKELAERKKRRSAVHAALALIVISGLFSLLYIFKTNQLATKGYNLKALEEQARVLRETNLSLNAAIQQAGARELIQARVADLQMVSAQPVFISATSTDVAMNR